MVPIRAYHQAHPQAHPLSASALGRRVGFQYPQTRDTPKTLVSVMFPYTNAPHANKMLK